MLSPRGGKWVCWSVTTLARRASSPPTRFPPARREERGQEELPRDHFPVSGQRLVYCVAAGSAKVARYRACRVGCRRLASRQATFPRRSWRFPGRTRRRCVVVSRRSYLVYSGSSRSRDAWVVEQCWPRSRRAVANSVSGRYPRVSVHLDVGRLFVAWGASESRGRAAAEPTRHSAHRRRQPGIRRLILFRLPRYQDTSHRPNCGRRRSLHELLLEWA